MASAHALHGLHHARVRPVPPAGVLVPFVAHGDLDAGQHAASQHRSHAGQSETAAERQSRFLSQLTLRGRTDQGVSLTGIGQDGLKARKRKAIQVHITWTAM